MDQRIGFWFQIKKIYLQIFKKFKETDFAITDLSHSKAIIEIEGQEVKKS
jgi:sarcosine oxidase gamma subunit